MCVCVCVCARALAVHDQMINNSTSHRGLPHTNVPSLLLPGYWHRRCYRRQCVAFVFVFVFVVVAVLLLMVVVVVVVVVSMPHWNLF